MPRRTESEIDAHLGHLERLIQAYMGFNVESVWKTVQVDLPELKLAVSAILG